MKTVKWYPVDVDVQIVTAFTPTKINISVRRPRRLLWIFTFYVTAYDLTEHYSEPKSIDYVATRIADNLDEILKYERREKTA